MKKFLLLALALSCFSASTAIAQVDIFFSTSSTDALAGTELTVDDGAAGRLFVWVDNRDASGNPVDGLPLDISGSGMSSLMATMFNVENPDGRWFRTTPGTFGNSPGLLVDDSLSASLTGGIENGVGPVLHATFEFNADGIGSNSLQLAQGNNVISVVGAPPQSVSFGTATVNVASAVPEPGSLVVLGTFVAGAVSRRRRRLA